jgi:hypothetical protein
MQTSYVERLLELAHIASSANMAKTKVWEVVEARFSLIFPDDYKNLVSSFGCGCFGAGLDFRSPFVESEYVHLSPEAIVFQTKPFWDMKETSNMPLYPDPNGAVVIANIDHQFFLLRPDRTSKLLSELVWWNIDTGEVIELNLSFSQFVHDLYLGKIGQSWTIDLREYIWRNGAMPLFVPYDLD